MIIIYKICLNVNKFFHKKLVSHETLQGTTYNSILLDEYFEEGDERKKERESEKEREAYAEDR